MAVQIGVDNLYYALCTSDTTSGVTYGAPVAIPGLIKLAIDPASSIDTLFADDGPAESVSQIGSIKLSITASDITLATQAVLLGHTVSAGVMTQKTSDIPPEVAILFRSKKSNGSYRYVKLLKGKFAVPKSDHETQGEKVSFQTPVLEGSFLRRTYDLAYKVVGDADAPGWLPATAAAWFTTVEAAPSALTIVTVPADAAVSAAVTLNLTATYNNAIDSSFVTDDYFQLIKAADGTLVANALTIDTNHKVVTLNPDSSLAGSAAAYMFVVSGLVKDVYGQKLSAGTTISNFVTTA